MLLYLIILATVLVSIQGFNNRILLEKWEYIPYLVHHRNERYRLFTHALVHADFFHLFVNMYVLFLFGSWVYDAFQELFGIQGIVYFLVLYVMGAVFAALPGYQKHKDNPYYRAVGASGAVSAVVFSAIVMYPTAELRLFFAIPMPAVVFGVIYLVYEYYMDKRSEGNIAHDAHYWGALFGVAATLVFKPSLALRFVDQLLSLFS